MLMRFERRIAVAGLAALLTVAACGGDGDTTAPATDDATAADDTAADDTDGTIDPPETTAPADAGDTTATTAATADDSGDEADQYAPGATVPGDESTGKPEFVLPDGEPTELVVTDLVEGTGQPLEAGDTMVAHYVGVLSADGTEFDESYATGQPISVPIGVGRVIPGWDQGLIGVKAGGRRQLDIPPSLAYGDAGAGGVIPPGASLTFVVDVIEVVEPPPPPSLAPMADASECPAPDGSSEQRREFDAYPPTCIDVAKTYHAEIETNHGTLVVELDDEQAPVTVNNFVVLARYDYFDDTECHRAIPGFMVQCGDPTATGTGGPGYAFGDELPEAGEYQIGSLAMANSGPGTNGSQFFIITGPQGEALPPNYSLFGQVTEGLDTTLPALDALGNDDPASNGVPPLEPITIESVTITET